MASKKDKIKVGDMAAVIIKVWTDEEKPSIQNYYEGEITEIVERAKHCFYVRVSGIDRLIPIDRVSAA